MHVHILGICGSFMGGIAAIAKSLGHHVTGSDRNVYPPMSTQLMDLGIKLTEGYDPTQFEPTPDIVIIGNAMARGNPAVEYVLNRNLPYTSGPQWLLDNLLKDRWVLGVAGTHGKTTTSSMVAWILDFVGLNPGFLIGGIPQNFGISARSGTTPFFVIEADEYDSAFFDKRSKFVHYRPRTLILNNLEFDHADIFPDLSAIQRQFHHLVRSVPGNGLIIRPNNDHNLQDVINQGCWSEQQQLGSHWDYTLLNKDGSHFVVLNEGVPCGEVKWDLIGDHNVKNGMMAIAAAHHAGVKTTDAVAALCAFKNVKRRMEVKGQVGHTRVYDDFAHHPTAIKTTLNGLRERVGDERIIAVLEPRSHTMKMGVHKADLVDAWRAADEVFLYMADNVLWRIDEIGDINGPPLRVFTSVDELVEAVVRSEHAVADVPPGTPESLNVPQQHILVMSNGGFEGIHGKLLAQLGKSE
ncbi:UDP-N-acetylmuramate:L-alanyl-gamma-D-glutamyl-meso-diaminopimelate ligase [Alteromonas oceanisediminis]|uniref:UDP-N-acetylmuramate:L-alanyl-gamma-D-glutamyl- meso-diaminopimelate ligase n=1 Tax=Alteromonas oceanisediminis TaxID=2836180 RepID=UPI001BDB2D30|nr:UDP-N-acetylmuramate:L-alanyl-gamma-D-glutamyl-meso-diaminopimelate ligase [Alteromonas oceanisediminis]MBT0586854.1 UDP-N-acetylmuramate:L-alanyl-gamma-D-glutamyl-meso-diaminopimelate ligase [Alteromonas oceanisediminis]